MLLYTMPVKITVHVCNAYPLLHYTYTSLFVLIIITFKVRMRELITRGSAARRIRPPGRIYRRVLVRAGTRTWLSKDVCSLTGYPDDHVATVLAAAWTTSLAGEGLHTQPRNVSEGAAHAAALRDGIGKT